MDYNLITILGPTATGKTVFGAHLAASLDGEIISADSRQVYREMDLGTGKDYDDYITAKGNIPFHLIDIHPPGYKYNVYEYQNDFYRVFNDIHARQRVPIMVGGTGMYIEAILNNYQMVRVPVNQPLRERLSGLTQGELVDLLQSYHLPLHNTSDTLIRKRTIRAIEIADYTKNKHVPTTDFPMIKSVIFGIQLDRNTRRQRISDRLKTRLEEGMLEEVEVLLKKVPAEDLIFYGLEYKYLTLHLTGKLDYAEMYNQLEIAIHQFAKRQMTWFRRMEKQGFEIHWIDGLSSSAHKVEKARQILTEKGFKLG